MASRGVWHAGLAGDAPGWLGPAIARGLAWEGRILRSREVSIVGNTRANGVMQDHNGPKLVAYPMVASALAWWDWPARSRPTSASRREFPPGVTLPRPTSASEPRGQ